MAPYRHPCRPARRARLTAREQHNPTPSRRQASPKPWRGVPSRRDGARTDHARQGATLPNHHTEDTISIFKHRRRAERTARASTTIGRRGVHGLVTVTAVAGVAAFGAADAVYGPIMVGVAFVVLSLFLQLRAISWERGGGCPAHSVLPGLRDRRLWAVGVPADRVLSTSGESCSRPTSFRRWPLTWIGMCRTEATACEVGCALWKHESSVPLACRPLPKARRADESSALAQLSSRASHSCSLAREQWPSHQAGDVPVPPNGSGRDRAGALLSRGCPLELATGLATKASRAAVDRTIATPRAEQSGRAAASPRCDSAEIAVVLAIVLDNDRGSERSAPRAVELGGQRPALQGREPCLLMCNCSMLPAGAARQRRCRTFTPGGRREQGSALRG